MGVLWSINKNITEAQKQKYMQIAAEMGVKYNVPYQVIVGVIAQESRFDPHAYRWHEENVRDRSFGLMQLVIPTGQAVANKIYGVGKVIVDKDYLYNPRNNIRLGTHYLRSQYVRFGTWDRAISAYNAGRPISSNIETYVKKVLAKGRSMPMVAGGLAIGSLMLGSILAWVIYNRIRR